VIAIVPPRPPPIDRKVLRRVKAHRCAQACVALSLLAVVSLAARFQVDTRLSIWALVVGVVAASLALAAAIGAVVYRLIETPREVTVMRGPFDWPQDPPVIHLNGKD
jgi:hypothetical protein